MSWLPPELAARLIPIVAGLALGTSAKYALAMLDGSKVTSRTIIVDVLLQGILALIAMVIGDGMGATGNARVMVGAMVALSSDKIVRQYLKRFNNGEPLEPPAPGA